MKLRLLYLWRAILVGFGAVLLSAPYAEAVLHNPPTQPNPQKSTDVTLVNPSFTNAGQCFVASVTVKGDADVLAVSEGLVLTVIRADGVAVKVPSQVVNSDGSFEFKIDASSDCGCEIKFRLDGLTGTPYYAESKIVKISGEVGAGGDGRGVNSIYNYYDLGKTPLGATAGQLRLYASRPSATLCTPAGLTVLLTDSSTEVIRKPLAGSAPGSPEAIRQVLSATRFIDVVTVTPGQSYRIDIYNAADHGAKDGSGLYVPAGTPYKTSLIESRVMDPVGATPDPELYDTERVGNRFRYKIPAAAGTYDVYLYFSDRYSEVPGSSVFSVNRSPLTDYDPFVAAGGRNIARVEHYQVQAEEWALGGTVTWQGVILAFESLRTGAHVAAIKVLRAGALVAAINCGGPAYTASDGTVFAADVEHPVDEWDEGSVYTSGFASSSLSSGLRITDQEAGEAPKSYVFTFSPYPIYNEDEFNDCVLTYPDGMRVGKRTERSGDWLSYNEIRTIYNGAGVLVSKTVDRYELQFGGFFQTKSIVDPEGVALTTLYEYNHDTLIPGDPIPNGYGALKRKTEPNGYWEEYSYDQGNRLTKTVRQHLNSLPGSEANSKVETAAYGTVNPIETHVTTLQGQEISRTYTAEFDDAANHEFERWTITAVTPGAAWDAADNLVTKTRSYKSSHPTALLQGQTKWTRRPDGVATLYTYALSGGNKVVTQETGAPDAGLTAIVAGTRTVTTTNVAGQTVAEDVIDIASGLTLSAWTALEIDDLGRPTLFGYGDGTTRSLAYVGSAASCGSCSGSGNYLAASETDRNGVTTGYAYDALNRRTDTTRLGVTERVVYDAADRVVETHRIGTDNSDIRLAKTVYDVAGRVIETYDALGNATTTTYTYPTGGGVVTTTTNPATAAGAGTRIETTYGDGKTASIAGTAVSPVNYAYGTHSLGEWTQEIKVGDDGATTEWTKTYTDLAGRAVKTEYPDAAVETMAYNTLGQLIRQTDPDGVTTLFAYNAKGEREVTALDLNRDGVLDYAGTDRLTKTVRDVVSLSGTVVNRTTTQVWATDGADTVTTVSVATQDGYGNQAAQTDAAGAVSSSAIARTGAGAWTVTSLASDGSRQVQTYSGGLLLSTIRKNSAGGQIAKTDYAYDSHNRVSTQTDARTGAIAYTYTARDEVLAATANNGTETTTNAYDALGNQLTITRPDASVTTSEYHLRNNQLKKTSGSQTYPVEYTYDPQGRMKTLTTWQNATTSAGSAVTTWNYDSQRGWLAHKLYADGQGPAYTYTAGGRLHTRTWARTVSSEALVTTYGYNTAGELTTTDYSDTTPDVAITYTRFGAQKTVTDATGTRTFTYTAALRADQEQLPSFHGNRILTRTYQVAASVSEPTSVPGRNHGFMLGIAGGLDSDYAVTYGYDSAGRLNTVTDPNGTFTYGYLTNSNLRHTLTGPVHVATTTYEPYRNVIGNVENKVGSTVVSNFAYTVNNLGQRTQRANTGTAFGTTSTDVFAYNAKGEVTGTTNATLTARDQSFSYDDIGNRFTATASAGTTNYVTNTLNQYTGWTRGTIARTLTQDLDGNLLSNGVYTYEWDAENRLTAVQLVPTADLPPVWKRVEYVYDYQGRRVSRKAIGWDNSTVIFDVRYIYDGWNVVAELSWDSSSLTYDLNKTLMWGLDLSGALQGAGGVGGLLSVKDGSSVYHYTYDANGNVSEVLDSSGGIVAHYEYDVFGNTVASSGTYAATNAYRFSTKPLDSVSDLYYYGFRYYDPSTGRWPNRDPIEEEGGVNVYGMIKNDTINYLDILGLAPRSCRTVIFVGHAASYVPGNPAQGDRAVLVTCKGKSANEKYEDKHPGVGIPDTGGKRNDGWIFPNPDGKYQSHPSYDEDRGDKTVLDAFNNELSNAIAEILVQCESCLCSDVTITIRSLDSDGASWMKANNYVENQRLHHASCNLGQ